ncbi:MAG TPA: hypothetical protein VKZ60_18635 [Chloroflexota bacterium]|nr:hypothetical protein [Chloroflexota bacterium]
MAGRADLPEDLRKQIEEALRAGQADRLPPPRAAPPRRPRVALPDPRPRSPQQLLLVSALVALAGWVVVFPFSRELLYLGLLGIGVALLSLLLRPQGRSRHYWRGRPVDLPPASWQERVYRLLYRD